MGENVDETGKNGGPATKTAKNVDGGGENGGPATKTGKNVDGAGKNGGPATKMGENVDEAAKSWTELALQPLHEAVYAGAGDGEVRGGDDAGLGTYAKAAAHEFGDAVDGFFGNYAAAGDPEERLWIQGFHKGVKAVVEDIGGAGLRDHVGVFVL